MDQFFETERELLQGIIDKDGDCIDASWCIMCPFSDICAFKAVRNAKLLPKEERVRRAFDRLFTELVDEELDD